jgi:hypothetical protein
MNSQTVLVENESRAILAKDICDYCAAPARVRATFINGELYFCGHHARKAGNKLVIQSTNVYDPEGMFNFGKQG